MYAPYVTEGHEYYRIFTCLFLHFGIAHLLNNMVMLGALGWNLELEIGKIRYIIIYFGSGIIGNIISLCYDLTLRLTGCVRRSFGSNLRTYGSASLCCDR